MKTQKKIKNNSFKKDVNQFFGGKRKEAIKRLTELGGLEVLGVCTKEDSKMFPGLCSFRIINKSKSKEDEELDKKINIHESLKFSLWMIYQEVVWAYIQGFDRISMIGCRAIAERALRIVYYRKTGNLAGRNWSLGPLIQHCLQVGVDNHVIDLVNKVKEEGDNLAHAKYETEKDWTGIEMRLQEDSPRGPPVAHYITGDSKRALLATRDLLKLIFGS